MEVAAVLLLRKHDALPYELVGGNAVFGLSRPVGSIENSAGILLGVVNVPLAILGNFVNDLVIGLAAFAGADGVIEITLGKTTKFGFCGGSQGIIRGGLLVVVQGFDHTSFVFAIFIEVSRVFKIGHLFEHSLKLACARSFVLRFIFCFQFSLHFQMLLDLGHRGFGVFLRIRQVFAKGGNVLDNFLVQLAFVEGTRRVSPITFVLVRFRIAILIVVFHR